MRRSRQSSSRDRRFTHHLGSIAFFLSIPTLFVGGCLLFIVLVTSLANGEIPEDHWILFGSGFALGMTLLHVFRIGWLRVLIHEVKHGIVVVLSGNVMQDIEVGRDTGHVEYAMYSDRGQFEPFIVLAPYFFPLFSLPVFIIALIFEATHDQVCAALLGLTVAFDLSTSLNELYPNQSDLQRIVGGFIPAALFVGGANFMWFFACCVWVQMGREGFGETLFLAIALGQKLMERWELQSTA